MSQSTPINLIRRNDSNPNINIDIDPTMSSDSQLVEDILKEMGDSPGAEQQSNINSQAFQYTMDSAQVPPTKYMPPQRPQEIQHPDYINYTQKMMFDNSNTSLLDSIGINLSGSSLKEKFMSNIKYPILVLVVCFLISLPEFNRVLFGFFPRLLLESGQVAIGGVCLKAIVGMVLFSGIAIFI